MRVTAQLLDMATAQTERTIKVDGRMQEIFVLQDRLVHELADLLRAVVEEEMGAALGAPAQGAAHRRRIGDDGVADAVPHAGDAGTAAARPTLSRCAFVEGARRLRRRRPGRPQRIEAGPQADARELRPRQALVATGGEVAEWISLRTLVGLASIPESR